MTEDELFNTVRKHTEQIIETKLELEREKLRNIIRQEIAASMVNGWGEHRRLVVDTLERLAADSKSNTQSIATIESRLAGITTELNLRSSVWGGIWGAVVAFFAAVLSYFINIP